MSDFVFNIAKGRGAYYASLPAANDALIVVPIEATGIESDALLIDYDNLSVILAASTNEQTTLGRKPLSGVTITVDDTNNRVDVDAADVVWTAASGNPLAALIICYDPDTTTGTDTDLVPIVKLDFAASLLGTDLTAQLAAAGFYRAG